MIRTLTAAAAAAIVLAVAACGGPPAAPTDVVSDTDRDRAAVLAADPVFATAHTPPVVVPGRLRSERIGWDRTEVRARVYEHAPPTAGAGPKPGAVELELITVLKTMRSAGWTFYWALCTPPPVSPTHGETPAPPVAMPADVMRHRTWQWVAFAYRIDRGVSYFALVSAELDDDAGSWVDVLLRAPQEHDPANVFLDQPKALAAGKSCVDDRKDARKLEQSGTLTYLRDWQPFPGARHSPDPSKR